MKSIHPVIVRFGICVGLLCFAAGVFAENPPKDTTALRGEFFCGVERRLALPFSGTVTELSAEVGQVVKKGDVLLRYELDARAEAEWNKAMSPVAVSEAEAELAAAEVEANLAETTARDAERMAGQKLIPAQQLEQARLKNAAVKVRLQAARERAELARKQFESRRERLAEQTGLDDMAAGESRSWMLRAPLDGVVVFLAGTLQPGALVEAGTPVVVMGVMDPMILRAHVHELEAVKLNIGDTADIQPLALPGVSLQGTVSRIAWVPVPHHLPEPSYYEMEMVVPNGDHAIHQGYKADILFNRTR